jgi:hypothetical protein
MRSSQSPRKGTVPATARKRTAGSRPYARATSRSKRNAAHCADPLEYRVITRVDYARVRVRPVHL